MYRDKPGHQVLQVSGNLKTVTRKLNDEGTGTNHTQQWASKGTEAGQRTNTNQNH